MKKKLFLWLVLPLPALAEMPLKVTEHLCDMGDVTDYVEFVSTDGYKRFNQDFFFFSGATVETAPVKGKSPGDRNSYRITMIANLCAGAEMDAEVRRKFRRMHQDLCERFNADRIGKIKDEGNRLSFSGKNIDESRWDVYAVAAVSNGQWHVRFECRNEYQKCGKFVGCDDLFKEE